MRFSLPSFAKINLHLQVLGKRGDGFHDIFTVFQTVSLHDRLTFENAKDKIDLECNDAEVSDDDSNLIIQTAKVLQMELRISNGARIRLDKRIPMGGGLGGGSSNAAVALIGLSKLWEVTVTPEKLVSLASLIGSDVPFFLTGGTAIGAGRGIDLEEVSDFEAKYLIVVTPNVHVSTSMAYAGLGVQSLTNGESNRILRVCRSEAESPDFLHSTLKNDFESTVFAAFPEIGRVKQVLLDLGAKQALMSGSGASVFAVFDKEETRQAALKALDNEVNWRKFAVAAVSRAEYREALERAL